MVSPYEHQRWLAEWDMRQDKYTLFLADLGSGATHFHKMFNSCAEVINNHWAYIRKMDGDLSTVINKVGGIERKLNSTIKVVNDTTKDLSKVSNKVKKVEEDLRIVNPDNVRKLESSFKHAQEDLSSAESNLWSAKSELNSAKECTKMTEDKIEEEISSLRDYVNEVEKKLYDQFRELHIEQQQKALSELQKQRKNKEPPQTSKNESPQDEQKFDDVPGMPEVEKREELDRNTTIINFLRENPGSTNKDIEEGTRLTKDQVRRGLEKLLKEKDITKERNKATEPYHYNLIVK